MLFLLTRVYVSFSQLWIEEKRKKLFVKVKREVEAVCKGKTRSCSHNLWHIINELNKITNELVVSVVTSRPLAALSIHQERIWKRVADRQTGFPWKRNGTVEIVGRENESRPALTTETRYRCVVIYNDYRRGPIQGRGRGWFLSLAEGNEGGTTTRDATQPARRCVPMALDYVARAASNRVSRFVWNLIPLREGSWNQDIWRGRNRAGGRATPSTRRSRRRRCRFSFAVAINRTYVAFSTFQLYWIGRAAPLARSIAWHARRDYRGWVLGTL